MKATTVLKNANEARAENPRWQPAELARHVGITEGELIASALGETSVRLQHDFTGIVRTLTGVSGLCSVLRSDLGLIENHAEFSSWACFGGRAMGGIAPFGVTLALSRWSEGFLVSETAQQGPSIQFFSQEGQAVWKVFWPRGTSRNSLPLSAWSHPCQKLDFNWRETEPGPVLTGDLERLDVVHFRDQWEAADTIPKWELLAPLFQLSRLESVRAAGEAWCRRLERDAIADFLKRCAASGMNLCLEMERAGNVQRWQGPAIHPSRYGKWINLLNADVNLHLDESAVGQVWKVKRRLGRQSVQTLECFDKASRPALRLFPGISADFHIPDGWNAAIESLPVLTIDEE